jgi:AcrR family transcriptional regulator
VIVILSNRELYYQEVALQARTRLARRAVIDAARELFLQHGYGQTTIESISAAADVPAPTVYRLFASKLGILKALLDVSIAGDDEGAPVADRPAVKTLLAETDPKRKLAAFVAVVAEVNKRTSSIYRILASAAATDPDARTLLEELSNQRQEGQGHIVRSLARSGALRPKVRERDASDIIHALASPEVYGLLVADRQWTPERYRAWLTDTLVEQVLVSCAAGGP